MDRTANGPAPASVRAYAVAAGSSVVVVNQFVAQAERDALLPIHPATGIEKVGGPLLAHHPGQGDRQAESVMKAQP